MTQNTMKFVIQSKYTCNGSISLWLCDTLHVGLVFPIFLLQVDSDPVRETIVFMPLHYPIFNMAWKKLGKGKLSPLHTLAYLSLSTERQILPFINTCVWHD